MSDRMPNSKQLAFGGWVCLRSGVWGAVLDVFLTQLSVIAAVSSGVFAMYPPGERSKNSPYAVTIVRDEFASGIIQ